MKAKTAYELIEEIVQYRARPYRFDGTRWVENPTDFKGWFTIEWVPEFIEASCVNVPADRGARNECR